MANVARDDARISFRLSRQHKELIEQAATSSGQALNAFAAATLLEKAREVLQAESYRALSERDARRFLELPDADVGPNEALGKAAAEYKKRHD